MIFIAFADFYRSRLLGELGSLPTAEKSAAVKRSVFVAAVMPERAGGLDEPDIYEEGSWWHVQGKLSGSDVEKLFVLFQLYVLVSARDPRSARRFLGFSN